MTNNMNAIVNSWWMYLLGIIVVLFVLGISVFFIIKAFKDAKELNMDTKIVGKLMIIGQQKLKHQMLLQNYMQREHYIYLQR